jgi:hypothetical protein
MAKTELGVNPTASSNQIATTAYVDTAVAAVSTAGAVQTTGAQSISGVKTFTSSPIVPTPTTTTQVANKGYVDTLVVTLANSPAGTYITNDYNFGTSTYPVRPTSRTDLIVVWRGPTAPPSSAGYALNGDEWRVKTS